MNIVSVIPLVASLLYFALFIFSLRVKHRMNRIFSVYLLAVGLRTFTSFIWHADFPVIGDPRWLHVSTYFGFSCGALLYHFVMVFLGLDTRPIFRVSLWAMYGLLAFVLIGDFHGDIMYVTRLERGHFDVQFGSLMYPMWGFASLGTIICLALLVRASIKTTDDSNQRNRLLYVALSSALILVGTFVNIPPQLRSYSFDHLFNVVAAFLMAYAIYRYQLMDLSLVIRKGLAYSALTAGIAATYLLTVFLFERLARTVLGYGAYLIPVLVAVVVAVALQSLRGRAQTWIDRLFFREKYDAQQMLHRLSRTVTSILDLDVLGGMLLEEVTTTMHITWACILLKEQKTGEFYLAAQRGLGQDVTDLRLRRDHPLLPWMARRGKALTAHEMDILPQFKAFWGEEKESLERLGAELFVPLLVKGDLVGLFAFGPKLFEGAYSQDEEITLTTLANQVAIALENARLFSEEQQRTLQLGALSEVSRVVSSTLDLDTVFQLVLEQLARVIPYDSMALWLRSEDTLYVAAARGFPNIEEILKLSVKVGDNFLFQAIEREKGPLIIADTHQDSRFLALGKTDYVRSWMGVPLMVKDRVIGTFTLDKWEPHFYHKGHAQMAVTFANQAAIAIQNARLYQAERKRAAQLAVVNQVARQAASILDLDQLLQAIVTAIQQGFGYYNVALFLLDEAASELELLAVAGGFADVAAPDYRQAVGVGMIGWTAETGQPLLANDVSREPRYISGFLEEPLTRSELCVPLKLAGQTIGVLDIQDTQLNTFDETDLLAMETLADRMAVAIENARLFGETKRRFEEIMALYQISLDITAQLGMSERLKSIVERAVTLLQAETGGIYLYDPQREELRLAIVYGYIEKYIGVTFKPGEGMAGRVFQSGEPLIVDDYRTWEGRAPMYEADQPFTAVLEVPLKWQDRIIGVLAIDADAQKKTFNQDDLWLATLFANQAAPALENARIYEEERKRATQLELIGGITQKVASILDLDELLSQVTHLIGDTFGYYETNISLVGGDELILKASAGPLGEALIDRLRVKIGREGIVGWVAHSGEPLLVNDVSREPRYHFMEETKATRSELAVPIKLKGEVIGVLDVQSIELDAFSQDDISILQTLADQLANAIENARLFDEAQRRAEQMAALRQMNIALTSTLEQEQVLGMILDQLKTILDYDSATIQTLSAPYTVHVTAARPPSHDEEMRKGFDASQNPLFYEMKNERKAVVIDDVHKDDRWVKMGDWEYVRSWVGVPLYARDNFLGFLNAEKGIPGFYKETHVQLLCDFAQGAALAIENARLFEAEAQRRQEAETLRQAAMALTSTLDLEEALDRILEQLYRVAAYDSASVQLLQGDYLEIVGGRGFADPSAVIGLRFPFPGDNPNTRVVESGQPIILADAQAAHAPFREPPHSHVRSWLGVPVGFRGQIMGLIALDSTELGHFTADHARLATAFANQAAVAIENARLFEETRRRMEQTQVLLRVSEATASALDSTEVMRRIAREAAQALGADMAGAYLLDETGKNLRPVAGYHVPPEWLETYQEFRIPAEGHPFVEEAWMSQRTIFTNDAANDSRFDEESCRLFHARSVLLTPMIVKGVIIGGLWAVWWEEAHHFTEEEQQLVEGIVRQAAIAFENARLYEQVTALAADLEVRVQERTAELARKAGELFSLYQASVALSSSLEMEEILKVLAQQAALALDAVDCTICELQDDALVVVTSYWDPALLLENPEIGRRYLLADYPATREALEKGQPLRVRVDDPLAHEAERAELQELGYTALLQVHIVSRDRVMGVVEVFDNKPEREFSEDDAALLRTIANQAGMAIERARLFQQVREERNHLELLYEVSRKLSIGLDLEQTLRDIFQVSVAATGASRGSIFVFDEEGRVAHRILMRDLTPAEAEDTIDRVLRQGLAGWVLEHKQPTIAFDTSRDERWLPFPEDPEPIGSAMVIPFIERDRVRGLLTLVHPQLYHFNQTHLELLSSIANQIAVVIERAQLHEHARRRAVQLATAAEVSRDATSTLDVGQLLTRTVDLVRDRFDLYYAGIFLVDEAGEYAVLQAGAGGAGRQMLKQGHKLQVGGTSMVGQCVANAQACIALDVGEEAGHFDNPLLPETRSEMALPLVSRGRVIGAMTIQSDRPAAFSEEDVAVLQTLADQLANAIENARLYGETRRWAQDAARQKEQTDAIVQSMADGLIVTDLENRLVLANPAAEELLEFRLEDAIGQEIGANIRDDRLCQTVRDTLDRQQPDYEVDIELTVSHDGSRRVMRAHTAVVNDPSGQPVGIVTTLRDVTHEREVQRLKDELVSTVSHELRTPMTSVMGFSELLLTRQLSEEKRQLYVQTIHKEAQRLSALINDFLDVQRMERGQQEYHFEEVDLGEIAHEMAATYSGQSEAHTLTLDLPPDLPLVQADSDRLRQVFGNLLSNAIKFSPGGGTVAVSVQAEGDEIHVAVSDEGIGIPAEALPHLFERFFRVDSSDRREIGGTGLGLAICREIVEAHGGRIWAESQEGVGTTVIFSLPRMISKRILVIDDEKDIRQMFQVLLSGKNYEVRTAANGWEGLSLMEAERPDLVILDIAMPVMNGYQFLEKVRGERRTKDIPVIAISGADTDMDRLKELGIDEFLSKPFSGTVLLETVRRLLQRP